MEAEAKSDEKGNLLIRAIPIPLSFQFRLRLRLSGRDGPILPAEHRIHFILPAHGDYCYFADNFKDKDLFSNTQN